MGKYACKNYYFYIECMGASLGVLDAKGPYFGVENGGFGELFEGML